MRKYKRMTWTDRLVIERCYNSGMSFRSIATVSGFSLGAVHYEVQRGLYRHLDGSTWEYVLRYSADRAQQNADWQATSKGAVLKLGNNYGFVSEISDQIKQGLSPDAIVGRRKSRGEWTVSTSTIYRYIDAGYIPSVTNSDLLEKSKRKPRKQGIRASRPPKGLSIEKRSPAVLTRDLFGHWEMDTVIGKRDGKNESCLVLTERKTRFEIIAKLSDKTTKSVVSMLSKISRLYPSGTFQTITVDNGSEFSDYQGIKQFTGEVYYCHPYCSCERGSNENQNRIIRRFFPKYQSLSDKTQEDCDTAAAFMNNLPRKILKYRTSAEYFNEEIAKLKKIS